MKRIRHLNAILGTVLAGFTVAWPTSPALSQTAAAPVKSGSDWQHVRALPPSTGIEVKATSGDLRCTLSAVTDDSLTCAHGKASTTFQRADVRSIKIAHRGRSALIGGAIGGGGLAIAGFAATSRGSSDSLFGKNFLRGQVTGVALAAGAVLGGGIGALTDFSKSTVYKAP